MWLLDNTLSLHEFIGEDNPKYAILSHRWGKNEATYSDLKAGNLHLPRLSKVRQFRDFLASRMIEAANEVSRDAKVDYLQAHYWLWIDTCCINKDSSAELTEAINSMFRWYSEATICYVYLSDVTATRNDTLKLASEVENSEWFTRGWTLQELLAPKDVKFVNRNWQIIGSKQGDGLMQQLIQRRTGVPRCVLEDFETSRTIASQERLKWAQDRKTLRVEDLAYCLLGIFDISMPVIYGEGTKAMERLKKAIEKKDRVQASGPVKEASSRFPMATNGPVPDFSRYRGLMDGKGSGKSQVVTPDAQTFQGAKNVTRSPKSDAQNPLYVAELPAATAHQFFSKDLPKRTGVPSARLINDRNVAGASSEINHDSSPWRPLKFDASNLHNNLRPILTVPSKLHDESPQRPMWNDPRELHNKPLWGPIKMIEGDFEV